MKRATSRARPRARRAPEDAEADLDGSATLVAVTGWGGEEARQQAEAAGFDHHLTKPVDLHALEPLLRKVSSRA